MEELEEVLESWEPGMTYDFTGLGSVIKEMHNSGRKKTL